MEHFSNTRPDLIDAKTRYELAKILPKIQKDSIITSSYNWVKNMAVLFYNNYVYENKLLAGIITIIVIFLLYRYLNRERKIVKNDNQKDIAIEKFDLPIVSDMQDKNNINVFDNTRLFEDIDINTKII